MVKYLVLLLLLVAVPALAGGIIGNNINEPTITHVATNAFALINVGQYTAVENDTVVSFHVLASCDGEGNDTLYTAIYNTSGGIPTTRHSNVYAVPIVSTNWGNETWHILTLTGGDKIALTAGNTYTIAVLEHGVVMMRYSVQIVNYKDNSSAPSLPTSWLHSSYAVARYAFYATVETGTGGESSLISSRRRRANVQR